MISLQSFDYCYGRHLPKLGTTRNQPDPLIHSKFSDTKSNRIWYILEGEKVDNGYILYGYVIGDTQKYKEFTFRQLEMKKTINLNILFKPRPLSSEKPQVTKTQISQKNTHKTLHIKRVHIMG